MSQFESKEEVARAETAERAMARITELKRWLEREAASTAMWAAALRHGPAKAQFEAESKAYERVLEHLGAR